MLTYKALQTIKTGNTNVQVIDDSDDTITIIANCKSVTVDKTKVIIVRNENDSMKLKLRYSQRIEFTSLDGYAVKIMYFNNKLVVRVKQISPSYSER